MATQTLTLQGESRRPPKVGNKVALPSESEKYVSCCQEIANALITEYEASHDDLKPKKDINLNSLRGKFAKKHRLSQQPPLTAIIAAVPEKYKKHILPQLMAKPVRSASGIAVVAVMRSEIYTPRVHELEADYSKQTAQVPSHFIHGKHMCVSTAESFSLHAFLSQLGKMFHGLTKP